MKIILSWLRDYVDYPGTPEELANDLTMLGLEVEGVEVIQPEFEGVVVAEVLEKNPHPDADRLSVCRVNDGKTERQIVCGASNFKAGDKVPLIVPGASLPALPGEKPFTIKVGKIRGVESQGMMCSPKELGLTEDADGLLILPAEAKVGQSFAGHLGRQAEADVLFDLEVTPNRPDLNSFIGIARELSALTGNPLKKPDVHFQEDSEFAVDRLVEVVIDDPDLCRRYTARVVRGVKVAPSPAWLKSRLERIGIRSINNVVDVTNYVLMETGHPLHAFDYHLLDKKGAHDGGIPCVQVRRAHENEKISTLDDQERSLDIESLLITDSKKGIALAGIMGGANTEIREDTVDVLVESAWFNPQNIRRTAKKLGLSTDSSYRFERGADLEICDWASRRAVQLIAGLAGGKPAAGLVDAYPRPWKATLIPLRYSATNRLLGVDVPVEDQRRFLNGLGIEEAEPGDDEKGGFSIPSFRVDLKREADLIEEIARLYGVDKIPSTHPRGAIGFNEFDSVHDQLMDCRNLLCGFGLNEIQGQTLVSGSLASRICGEFVKLERPLSGDMDVLRPSLLPGLIEIVRHNVNRKNESVRLFEIGRVFTNNDSSLLEERRLVMALTGTRDPVFWSGDGRGRLFDFFDLKGVVEGFLDDLGIGGIQFQRESDPKPFLLEAASLIQGKFQFGFLGQIHPLLAREFDIRHPLFVAELSLDLLLKRRKTQKNFKALPAHPSIRRDIAMLLPESVTHQDVLSAVKKANVNLFESVELFDVYRGENVPKDQKSVAYAFTYRDPNATLTDVQVNKEHEKIVETLKTSLSAVIR